MVQNNKHCSLNKGPFSFVHKFWDSISPDKEAHSNRINTASDDILDTEHIQLDTAILVNLARPDVEQEEIVNEGLEVHSKCKIML